MPWPTRNRPNYTRAQCTQRCSATTKLPPVVTRHASCSCMQFVGRWNDDNIDVATPVSQRQARPGHSVAQRSSWELLETASLLRRTSFAPRLPRGVVPEENGKQGWCPNGARTATSCPPRRPGPRLELRIPRNMVLMGAAPAPVHPKRLSRPRPQLELRTRKTMMQLKTAPAPVLPKRLRLRVQQTVAAMPWLTLHAGAQHIPPARHAECVHCASGQSNMASPKHAHQMLEQTAAKTVDELHGMPQVYPQGMQR